MSRGSAGRLGPKRGWGARPIRDAGDAAPYGCSTGSAQQRADVPEGWPPPLRPAGGRGTARRVVVPYGWLRRAAAIALGSGAQRSVCGADGRNGLKLRQRSPQKCLSKPDNPSVSLRLTAPFAQGSLGDGGCGLPRRFAPRNDSPDPLSFRGGPTGRRGNPSFLRWTGVRAAVPRAWPPPTKFRPEIWGVGQVVGPYGWLREAPRDCRGSA